MWRLPEVGTDSRCDYGDRTSKSCPKRTRNCDGIYGVFGGDTCIVYCANDPDGPTEEWECSGHDTWSSSSESLVCGKEEPKYTCGMNPRRKDKTCTEGCCKKQKDYDLTCYWDGDACVEGEGPMYAECTLANTMWKKGPVVKKSAENVEECYEMCRTDKGFKKGATCRGWTFLSKGRKNCRLYPNVRKSAKKNNVLSGKSNCHPFDGKQEL